MQKKRSWSTKGQTKPPATGPKTQKDKLPKIQKAKQPRDSWSIHKTKFLSQFSVKTLFMSSVTTSLFTTKQKLMSEGTR
jgi:hypothetical protein